MPIQEQLQLSYDRHFHVSGNPVVASLSYLGILIYTLYLSYHITATKLSLENLPSICIGALGILVCFSLIYIKRWPDRLNKFKVFYWHLALIFIFPFTATYILLQSGQQTTVIALFTAMLCMMALIVIEWVVVLMAVLGITLGLSAYYILIDVEVDFRGVYFFIFGSAAFFILIILLNKSNYARAALQGENNGIKIGHDGLAQELKGILDKGYNLTHQLNETLPHILDGYWVALRTGEYIPVSGNDEIPGYNSVDRIGMSILKDIYYAKSIIDMSLLNAQPIDWNHHSFERISTRDLLESVFELYPLHQDESKPMLPDDNIDERQVYVPAETVRCILFSLIRDGLKFSPAASLNDLSIKLEANTICLVFNICSSFSEYRFHSALKTYFQGAVELNLANAREVMRSLGGDLLYGVTKQSAMWYKLCFLTLESSVDRYELVLSD